MTNTHIWKVERETETTQAYFYDTPDAGSESAQVALYAKELRTEVPPAEKVRRRE